MLQMVIANRLRDGAVVFLAAGDEWRPWIGDGRVFEGEDAPGALELAKRHEADNIVVEPSLIEVEIDAAGLPRPVAVRESIRAFGPTIGSENISAEAAGGRSAA